MDGELAYLQGIGAQKIAQETNIPLQSVQAILHQSFEGFSKVQFIGFLSILEREYKLELPEMRAKSLEYFDAQEEPEYNDILFGKPKKRVKLTLFYLLLASLLFIMAVSYTFTKTSTTVPVQTTVENTLIKKVVKRIDKNKKYLMLDVNKSVAEKKVVAVEMPKVVERSLQIHPLSKVWLGYIDVATGKKYQKTFDTNLSLDANRTWLFIFGHGYIDIYVNGRLEKFDSRDQKRFYYKDGKLQALSLEEFKAFNRGHAW